LGVLKRWLEKNPNSFIQIIPQKVCRGSKHLKEMLDEVEKMGAEGLVVRDPDASYVGKRSSRSLKVKSFRDDECVVTGYTDGAGKFKGLVGALLCKWHDRTLRIGSGLSQEERENPPQIGSMITFKYNGFSKKGNPKFPVFLRVRE
jgi:DNA ligase-1